MVKKKASKNDVWQGQITERVNNLVKVVGELKTTTEKGFEKVDEKFSILEGKIDDKFDKHNLHHLQQDKKYLKYLFILTALVVGSLIANPKSAIFVWSLIKVIIGVF